MQLMNMNEKKTMNSREIAALTGKEHKNVMSDIRRMMDDISFASADFLAYLPDGYGRNQPAFILDKELTMTLIAGYSANLRYKIVMRWADLEAKQAFQVPTTLAGALRLAAEQAEQIEAQASKISADAPKVAFAEAIRAVDGVCSIEKIAKTIGIGRNKFFKLMRDDSILMDNNLPYQKYLDREYFTVIEQEPYTDSKGETHPTFTTKVTGAGQVFLARKYSKKEKA